MTKRFCRDSDLLDFILLVLLILSKKSLYLLDLKFRKIFGRCKLISIFKLSWK